MVELDPLSTTDVESLVVHRRRRRSSQTTCVSIVDIAEGNPLFAEQLLITLDDGPLEDFPISLRGLLTTRLDRLGPGERDLLRCASIVGLEFESDAVSGLLPTDARPFSERHLESLAQRRFIQRTGRTSFRFGHALIRMAAYQSIPHEDRAALHERFADWLGRESPDLLDVVGFHLDQAMDHRRSSGISAAVSDSSDRAAAQRTSL